LDIESLIRDALTEDLPDGHDVTSECFVPESVAGDGWIESRQEAVVSGLGAAARVFHIADPTVETRMLVEDGARVSRLQHVMELRGPFRSILTAERTALNFLCHLSGIATRTREFVDAVSPWGTKILCTRKTTPGLRDIEIAAVRHGGGDVYRTNLSDGVLLKDNHEGILGGMREVRVRLEELQCEDAPTAARVLRDGKIECSLLEDVAEAVDMGWPRILLDNFSPADAAEAVRRWGSRVFLEVSGGVNLSNVREYAATGVNAISIGAITHSARAADFSLEVQWRES
jgi:nicotinate-nucleotide pyrophosphorylase (carboxylating)